MTSFLTILLLLCALLDVITALVMGGVDGLAKLAFQLSRNICLGSLSTAILHLLDYRTPVVFWAVTEDEYYEQRITWLTEGFLLLLMACLTGPIFRRKAFLQQMYSHLPLGCYSLDNKCYLLMQAAFMALPLVVYGAIVIMTASHINYGIELKDSCCLSLVTSALNTSNSFCLSHDEAVAFVQLSQLHWQWMATFSASITNVALTGLFLILNRRTYQSFISSLLRYRRLNRAFYQKLMSIAMEMPVSVMCIFLVSFAASVFVSLNGAVGNAPMTTAEGMKFLFTSVQASFCFMLVTTVVELVAIGCSMVDHVHIYRQIDCNPAQAQYILALSLSTSFTDATRHRHYYHLAVCGRGPAVQAALDQNFPAAAFPRHQFASWDEIPVDLRTYLQQHSPVPALEKWPDELKEAS